MNGSGGDGPILHEFGRWRFDAGTGDLFDGATITRLEPQVARLLDYFLIHQNTLISRDELMTAVWDNRIVSDHAVNRCISILRNQLSPDERNAYIETVVRRGFISHFPPSSDRPPGVATDERADDTAPGPAPAAQKSRSRRGWMPVALAGVAAAVAFGVFRLLGDGPPPAGAAANAGAPMVAVLPFISAGLAGESDFFARGIHDDLLTQLAQLQSIRVISRTSVSEYRDSQRNIREIGRDLGADAILEGGVQHVGDQIRINVQLIDARTDVHLWAQQYDRELTPANIFDIQAEIARSIASALQSTLTRRDATQLDVLPTDNMAAYRAYHEAMELRDTETIAAPAYVAALERAVALDPEFVRARAELAGSLSYINIQERDPESIRRLENQLERIRALAPESSEYLIAQSYFTYYILKDHDRAFELVTHAQYLRPSDPQVLELQSWIQRRQGDIDGVIDSIREARTLDPRNPYWTRRLAINLMAAHRYDEAAEELDSAPFESFRLSALRSTLRVREHGEPGRLLDDLVALQREYGEEATAFELWEAHIAARDYDGATALLNAVQQAESPAEVWSAFDIPDIGLARVITERLLNGPEAKGPVLAEARRQVAAERAVPDFAVNADLAMAYVTAAEGDRAETERLIRTWFREATADLAERLVLRHHACRALGLATAVNAAVDCLRSGLAEPSQAIPFIEPFLPYYDSIRDDPRFVDFVAALTRSAAGARAPTG
ncbi:winged helix-turn-helix domain-containing tetratricopeptide repeat protein [Lentisalinibacter orientalis]|uniref:winged helix-turn-helix domain-containing tetratricopeptide repeat protein n=1 Tax=Lentisalinibacter orientalis TaxID=2992241 RepID=UPI0038695648